MRSLIVLITLLTLPLTVLAERTKVVMLPFASNDADPLGKAVQASVVADLSRNALISAEGGPVLADGAQAIAHAKSRDACYLIIGGYQTIDGEVRLLGQILDVNTGNVIGGLKATGPMRDLFGLQDAIAGQAQRAILIAMNPAPPPAPAAAPAPAPQPNTVQAPVTPYSFAGSDLERSLNSPLAPSKLYDYNYAHGRYSYYFGDRYTYVGEYPYVGYGWSYWPNFRVSVRYTIPARVHIEPSSNFTYSPSGMNVRY
jgi:TolB-like protein